MVLQRLLLYRKLQVMTETEKLSFWQMLEQWVFPPTCVLSGQPAVRFDLAEEYLFQLKPLERVCSQCALPLPNGAQDATICGQCLKSPPSFQQTVAGFEYEGIMQQLMVRYKFQPQPSLSRLLFELYWARQAARIRSLGIETIVAVPAHPSRIMEYGFNPAVQLAKPLAKALGVPLLKDAVLRTVATPPQHQLSAKERRQNLKNAFQVEPSILEGISHIAVVDDVMTTGTTLDTLAKVIHQNSNIKQVTNLVIARAV